MRLQAIIAFAAVLSLGLFAAQGAAQAGSLSDPASLSEQAPPVYKVKFDTSKGDFVVEVHRDWAPNGADRFYNLVKNGFFNDARFFRVVEGFMVQFGIHGDPKVAAAWRDANIKDDPVKQSNKRGMITFATAGPEYPHDAGVHQFRRQRLARRAGLLAVRQGDLDGMDVVDRRLPVTAKARPMATAPIRASCRAGQRLSRKGVSQAGLHQDGDNRKIALRIGRIAAMAKPEDTLVIETTKGRVTVEMWPDLAPKHVARIKELARKGFYDGVVFHRVIDGFMAQTGDPTGSGMGGSGQKLKAEFNKEPHTRGAVSMARSQSPEFRR